MEFFMTLKKDSKWFWLKLPMLDIEINGLTIIRMR